MSSHNEAFVDVFHNALKEVIYGFPDGQGGPAYYNIPDPSTQGTNLVGTSHQEAAPTSNSGVQTLQGSSEQTPGTTTNQIQYNPRPSVQHMQQPTGQMLEPDDQFWHIMPHTIVGSKNSTIDSKDP